MAPRSSVWAFEFHKNDLDALQPFMTAAGTPFGILRWHHGDFPLNLLAVPPNVAPQTWISELAAMFQTAYDLPAGASRLLKNTLHDHYSERGVFEGGRNYGTIFDLTKRIQAARRTHPSSRDALLERCEDITKALPRKALAIQNCQEMVQQLEEGHYLFSLEGLDYSIQCLVANWYVAWPLKRRIKEPRDRKPLFVILEEAKEFITRPNSYFVRNIELVRGAGISICFVTQEAAVHSAVRNACSMKLMGVLDAPQVADLAPSFGLRPPQRDWWVDNQRPRLFLAKCDLLQHKKAFLFRTAEIDLPTTLEKEEHRRVQEATVGRLWEKADSETDARAEGDAPETIHADSKGHAADPSPVGANGQISDELAAYLETVVQNPDLPSSAYDSLVKLNGTAGVGRAKGDRIRTDLIERALVKPAWIRTGGKKDYKLLCPTAQGLDRVSEPTKEIYLRSHTHPNTIRPGPEHAHKVEVIRRFFAGKGFTVSLEKQVALDDGRTICLDLLAVSSDGGERVGVEVQETDLERVPEKMWLLQRVTGLTDRHVVVPSRRILAIAPDVSGVRLETLARFLS